ncbi:radical SAM family heme chaperone HemW [Halanaerocella petrolearia]
MTDYGLYIHIPFCIEKCHYCDFNSVSIKNNNLITEFAQALEREIELLADKYSPKVETIFIGGGTPTVLSGSTLAKIITKCQQELSCSDNLELTVEANPGSLDREKLITLKRAGVNRLSFGVQSFNDYFLEQLGRIHTVQQAIDNYYLAREVGFDNINLDLIFALPGQSLRDWKTTLDLVCQLNPDHLSTYNLKFEEGTLYYQWLQEGKLEPVSEELDLEMYQLTKEKLENHGYQQYEISNFAQDNKKCFHNKRYWLYQPYLAVGPGAHFYDGEGRGYNYNSIKKYCQQIKEGQLPVANYQELVLEEQIEERMMMGLRLTEGILLANFKARYNLSVFDLYKEKISRLKETGLISIDNTSLSLTTSGMLMANQVISEFLLT